MKDLVRNLRHDSRSVTGDRISIDCAPVREVFQSGDCSVQNLITGYAMHVGNKSHAARVVFLRRVIEPLLGGIHGCGGRWADWLLGHRNIRF